MVSLKYSFWRPTNTLKTWFRENIRFGELSSTTDKTTSPGTARGSRVCEDGGPEEFNLEDWLIF